MRKITVALLSGAYLCLALTLALLLWRSGGGWGAGVAGLTGTLGLAFALHGLVARGVDRSTLSDEISQLRDANLILLSQMEVMQTQIGGLSEAVQQDAVRRSEELSTEVRVLEDLVKRMGESLDARLSGPRPVAASAQEERQDRQTAALLNEVRSSLTEGRVDLFLQPVVNLPQRRTVFYESYTRLRDESGRVMMPGEYLAVAEPDGLVSAIDNLLLFRCVQIVRRLAKQDRKVGIFCNISLTSLGDEAFFPSFLDFLAENRDAASALIFELGQSAFESRGSVEARNMGKLADLGFRFSLDKVTDLDLDFADLARADVKFVKVAADVLLGQLLDPSELMAPRALRDIQASDFAALTRRYGVEVIAEKVEAERQVVDILDLDIAYGQGHLFGEPRAIREAVLAEAESPPADYVRPPLRRAARR